MRPNRLFSTTLALALAGAVCVPSAALADTVENAEFQSAIAEAVENADPAATSATVTVENTTATPGSTVNVPVRVSSNTNLSGAQIAFSYDPSAITVTGVHVAGLLSSAEDPLLTFEPLGNGEIVVSWTVSEELGIAAEDGIMYELEVAVSETASHGDSVAISARSDGAGIVDLNTETVETTFEEGTLDIETARGSAIVSVGSATAKPGQIIRIPVNIASTINLSGAQIALSYDPTVLVVQNVNEGIALSEASDVELDFVTNAEGSKTTVSWTVSDEMGIAIIDGAMYELEISVSANALDGRSAVINANQSGVGVIDFVMRPVDTTFSSGEIDIQIDVIPGDVNDNGTINIVDAQITYDLATGTYGSSESDFALFPYPTNWSANTLFRAADINSDEVIDAADARAIQTKLLEG